MNLTPEQIQEHITKLSDATVEDLDDLLHDLAHHRRPEQLATRPHAGPANAPLRLRRV